MMVRDFFRALVQPARCYPDKPADEHEFHEARKRLVEKSRELAREADAFGAMIRDMRGKNRKKKPTTSTAKKA